MSAADTYNAMVVARAAQQERLQNPLDATYWARYAPSYRFDPHRSPEPLLRSLLRHVEFEDDIIEIGGGAGRIGLPLALRAKSLLNVEPTTAMREQFDLAAAEHGINNAAALGASWPHSESLNADLVVTVDVTYFIADIEPFLRAMHDSARRRVAILTWTVPPPNANARLFHTIFGEAEAPSPGFRELLPVLWDMGIIPNVQVVDEPFSWPARIPTNDEEAITRALNELGIADRDDIRALIRPHLGELFDRDDGYRPQWPTPSRGMIITWATS